MKHSTRCVQLETDELVWLCQSGLVAALVVPQSLLDLVANWPPNPPGVPNAQSRVTAKLTLALQQRSDTRRDYAWPFSKTPPSWARAPQQGTGAIPKTEDSVSAGPVVPPAPWSPAGWNREKQRGTNAKDQD